MKTGLFHKLNLILVFTLAALTIALLTGLVSPPSTYADGCFVAPPFVWDKHRDINEPTQKAILLYDAGQEHLILQVKYDGPVEQFGWLVPVPAQPAVQPGSMESFYALSRYTQENWEPQAVATRGEVMDNAMTTLSAGGPPPEPVKVVEIKTVGAYEIAVLSATEPGSLENWLTANQFSFPKERADVIDEYVSNHWYFVAIKIDLRKAGGFKLIASPRHAGANTTITRVSEKLAAGELPPLQLSFATSQCVFPLKISSVNGTPSEVQVYVLSPDPLVERRMFEKKFPELKRQALEQAAKRIKMQQHSQEIHRAMLQQLHPEITNPPGAPVETNLPVNEILRRFVPEDSLLHYGAVTENDLPNSALPGFAGKTWWLTKQTWTFASEDMQDLYFQPAAAVFAADLDNEMGYYAAENLARLGSKAVPALLAALQNANAGVRIHATTALGADYGNAPLLRDPRLAGILPELFQDPEWEVRQLAIQTAAESWQPEFTETVIQHLRDENEAVQGAAVYALFRNRQACRDHIPDLQQMLKDKNLQIRGNAFQVLSAAQVPVPREVLLSLLTLSDLPVLNTALQQLERDGVSNDELQPLRQNRYMPARLLWLRAMRDFEDKSAINDIIPLLRDPEPQVQYLAWQLLQSFTGQTIPMNQPDQWAQWWAAHQNTFLIDTYTQTLAEHPTDGATWHDRGCLYYDQHNFPKALADFRQAAKLGSEFQDYSHYRIWLIRARLGETASATKELDAYLQSRPPNNSGDWPLQVGHFLIGQLAEPEFLQAATSPNPKTDQEQHCEAWFYVGMKQFIAGDQATATNDFQKCLATHVTGFEEYQSAAAELKFMNGTVK